jgi:hypothetical protein
MNWNEQKDGGKITPPGNWTKNMFEMAEPGNGTKTKKTMYEWLTQANNQAIAWYLAPETTAQLRGGPLLNVMLDQMKEKVRCMDMKADKCDMTRKLKYSAYSSHDVTILALLRTMGDTSVIPTEPDSLPKYAAAVAVELWGPNNNTKVTDYMVQVKYHTGIWYDNGQPSNPVEWETLKTTTQCKNMSSCTLETFMKNSEKYTDYTEFKVAVICALTTPSAAVTASVSQSMLILSAVLAMIVKAFQ